LHNYMNTLIFMVLFVCCLSCQIRWQHVTLVHLTLSIKYHPSSFWLIYSPWALGSILVC
jgi:hypothetical protein